MKHIKRSLFGQIRALNEFLGDRLISANEDAQP